MTRVCCALLLAVGLSLPAPQPAFASQRASRVVFVRIALRHGWPRRLWTMDSDGSHLHRIPDPFPHGAEEDPAWSPDGTQIAFTHALKDHRGSAVFTMGTNGLHAERLTPNWLDATGPTWSPDGHEVAFSAKPSGSNAYEQLWVIDRDGTDLRGLTRTRYDHLDPSWSPDGTELAYERSRSALFTRFFTVGNIYVKDLRVGDGSTVTHFKRREASMPDWSPDGSQIAFLVGSEAYVVNQVWVARPDGSDATMIRETRIGSHDHAVVWSPGGGELLVAEEAYGIRGHNLWDRFLVMDPNGRHTREILGADNSFFLQPDWTTASK
jgi:Tol biopolymer transport system component